MSGWRGWRAKCLKSVRQINRKNLLVFFTIYLYYSVNKQRRILRIQFVSIFTIFHHSQVVIFLVHTFENRVLGIKATSWLFQQLAMFSLDSVTKIFVITVKSLKPATQPLLVWETRCYHSASKAHVRDRILKFSPIHASVTCQFPWIHWIQCIPVPFRENSIAIVLLIKVEQKLCPKIF